MIIENISNISDIENYLNSLGADGGGIKILADKTKHYTISIKDLHVGAANILKQDALSIGADLAVPRGTVLAKNPRVDTLLIATRSQLKKLAKKELAQPFGLREVAGVLKKIADEKKREEVMIMGVINANDDSFYSQSRFNGSDAIQKIQKMIAEGATIIDIGAVSSRPNAPVVSAQEELVRIKPIIDMIAEQRLCDEVTFSIDSYEPKVIEYALESGFRIINDITALSNDAVCELAAKYRATVIMMHMQGTPQTMQDNPHYFNVLDEVYTFLQERIEKANSYGIDDIIIDIGIGFGKSLEDNLSLIKYLEHFLTLGRPLLVGASRKSMIDAISRSAVEERLAGTLTIHLEAIRNGASILRVHDVKEHVQAIKVYKALEHI